MNIQPTTYKACAPVWSREEDVFIKEEHQHQHQHHQPTNANMNFYGASCSSSIDAQDSDGHGSACEFMLDDLQYKEMEPYTPPSPIRISTISALAYLRINMSNTGKGAGDSDDAADVGVVQIDLDRLYERLPLVSGGELGVTHIKTYEKVSFADGRKPEITQLHRQCAPTVAECFGKLIKNAAVKRILSVYQLPLDTCVADVSDSPIAAPGAAGGDTLHAQLLASGTSLSASLREDYTQAVRNLRGGVRLHMKRVKSYFQNQLTLIWTFQSSTGVVRQANCFIFNNGKIKSVGLKSSEDIQLSFAALLQYLQKHRDVLQGIFTNAPLDEMAPPSPTSADKEVAPRTVTACLGPLLARCVRPMAFNAMHTGDLSAETCHDLTAQYTVIRTLAPPFNAAEHALIALIGDVSPVDDERGAARAPLERFSSTEHGHTLLRAMKDEDGAAQEQHAAAVKAEDCLDALVLREVRPTMFNTDFSAHFKIMRDEFFRIIVQEYFLTNSEYEPDIYPAVKVKFRWNSLYLQQPVVGICYCKNREACKGRGSGTGEGCCKTVTACVFQTGKVIITGGNDYEQVQYVYSFINDLIKRHYDEIYYREPLLLMPTDSTTGEGGTTARPKAKASGAKTTPSQKGATMSGAHATAIAKDGETKFKPVAAACARASKKVQVQGDGNSASSCGEDDTSQTVVENTVFEFASYSSMSADVMLS